MGTTPRGRFLRDGKRVLSCSPGISSIVGTERRTGDSRSRTYAISRPQPSDSRTRRAPPPPRDCRQDRARQKAGAPIGDPAVQPEPDCLPRAPQLRRNRCTPTSWLRPRNDESPCCTCLPLPRRRGTVGYLRKHAGLGIRSMRSSLADALASMLTARPSTIVTHAEHHTVTPKNLRKESSIRLAGKYQRKAKQYSNSLGCRTSNRQPLFSALMETASIWSSTFHELWKLCCGSYIGMADSFYCACQVQREGAIMPVECPVE